MISVGSASKIRSDINRASAQIGGPRRSVASLTGTQSWSDKAARFAASVRVQDGTVLLQVEGRLDAETLRTCHLALAAALRVRTRRVTVDLSRAKLDHRSVEPLVHLIRSASRFGAVLALRDLPLGLRGVLAQAAPTASYALVAAVAGRSPRLPNPAPGRRDDTVGPVDDGELPDDDRPTLGAGSDFDTYADLVVIEALPRRR